LILNVHRECGCPRRMRRGFIIVCRRSGRRSSFTLEHDESYKFTDSRTFVKYNIVPNSRGQINLQLFHIPPGTPEPESISIRYELPNLQENLRITNVTISRKYALIEMKYVLEEREFKQFQLWNLSKQLQIPLPDFSAYLTPDENSLVLTGVLVSTWHLDTNMGSKMLVATIMGPRPFVLVFSGFDSPTFLHRLSLPKALLDFHKCVQLCTCFRFRMIITGDIPKTALLVSYKSKDANWLLFVMDLYDKVRSDFNINRKGFKGQSLSTDSTLPYHCWLHPHKTMLCKISFDGRKFYMTEMEVKLPNTREIRETVSIHNEKYCKFFTSYG
jgi:hypothetical protein